jgi:putative membrane protein
MKRIGILSVTFAAMIAIGCQGNGRDADATSPATDTPAVGTAGESANRETDVNMSEKNFAEDVMMSGMAEIELGQLAAQKAQNADVKKFAQTMVDDHTTAGNDFKALAAQHQLQPPAQLDETHRDLRDRLSKLSGAEFDREYIEAMVDGHENMVDKLEPRIDERKGENMFENKVNDWAAKTLPTVRQHLDRAKQLNQTLSRRTTDR